MFFTRIAMKFVANTVWTTACMGSSISTETHAQSDAELALDAHLVNRPRLVRDRFRFACLRARHSGTGARRRLDGLAPRPRGGPDYSHYVHRGGAAAARHHSALDDDGLSAGVDGRH